MQCASSRVWFSGYPGELCQFLREKNVCAHKSVGSQSATGLSFPRQLSKPCNAFSRWIRRETTMCTLRRNSFWAPLQPLLTSRPSWRRRKQKCCCTPTENATTTLKEWGKKKVRRWNEWVKQKQCRVCCCRVASLSVRNCAAGYTSSRWNSTSV